MIERILWFLVGLSWLYWISVWWGMRRFFRRDPGSSSEFAPPVSVLKPAKGLDDDAYENFASFCRQQYPLFEVLFGFAEPDDPAVPLVVRLQQDFPDLAIRTVVVPPNAANPKTSILAELSKQARHGVLVVADSDIRVAPNYLQRVVAPLRDSQIGLVTCPYRTVGPRNWAAAIESLYFNTSFLPSAIAAHILFGASVSFGATQALRKVDLHRIGGYQAIGDYLSDDYHLARRIERLGYRMHLSNHIVSNVIGETNVREQWSREVRLARGIRRLCPLRYFGLLLTFPLPLAILLFVVSGLSAAAGAAVGVSLLARWSFAGWMLGRLKCRTDAWLSWLPVRDGLSAIVWAWSAFGKRVRWRGQTFSLDADGRLHPAGDGTDFAHRNLRRLILGLDRLLRSCYGITEFSDRKDCLLRLSAGRAGHEIRLSDGTHLPKGERIGELHFWNEHVAAIGFDSNLRWGREFRKQMRDSLGELAQYVAARPEWNPVKAFRSDLPYGGRNAARSLARMADFFGVDVLEPPEPVGVLGRLHAWGERLLLWALVWAFNPDKLQAGRFTGQRWHIWLSREVLLNKFGTAAANGSPDVSEEPRPPDHHTGTSRTAEHHPPLEADRCEPRWPAKIRVQ